MGDLQDAVEIEMRGADARPAVEHASISRLIGKAAGRRGRGSRER